MFFILNSIIFKHHLFNFYSFTKTKNKLLMHSSHKNSITTCHCKNSNTHIDCTAYQMQQ